jgi:hypothetical protein
MAASAREARRGLPSFGRVEREYGGGGQRHRDRHEHRDPRSVSAGVAEAARRRDRDARPRDAGDQRDRLPEADADGVPERPSLELAGFGRGSVDPPERDAEDDHRPADHRDRAEQVDPAGDGEDGADDERRDGGDGEREGEEGVGRGEPAAQDLQRPAKRAGDLGPEIEDDGEIEPRWTATSSASASVVTPMYSCRRMRWPDDEIGRNSVMPCTTARIMR